MDAQLKARYGAGFSELGEALREAGPATEDMKSVIVADNPPGMFKGGELVEDG